MILSIKLKSALASIMFSTGMVDRKLRRYAASDFPILMYHRIIPPTQAGSHVQAGMIVEPDTFDGHIQYLKKNFDIVPLAELPILQLREGKQSNTRRLCAITFDDGWYDFYEHAFPILKYHDTPATVFLPTGYIGTNHWFWTDRFGFLLERLLKKNTADSNLPVFKEAVINQFLNTSGNYEMKLEKGIDLLKACKLEVIEQILVELAAHTGAKTAPSGRAFLTWNEVQAMAQSGLISFGSHTVDHPILTTLEDNTALQEIKASKKLLLSKRDVAPSIIAFSYPNGEYNDRLKQMVKDNGYHLAVSTLGGWNRQGEDRFALRRIAIHQGMASSEAMFAARIARIF